MKSSLVTDDDKVKSKLRETIDDLAAARAAFGFGDAPLACVATDLATLVPADKCAEAMAHAKSHIDAHVNDVALAAFYDLGSQLVWPGSNARVLARHAFMARDLLDLRLGCDDAARLVATVRTLLAQCEVIGTNRLLEDFLARRRIETAKG
jgi:hypothetical protein